MKLTGAQEKTLLALWKVGGAWVTYSHLQELGGYCASVPVLKRLGLVEEMEGEHSFKRYIRAIPASKPSPNSGAQLGAVSL